MTSVFLTDQSFESGILTAVIEDDTIMLGSHSIATIGILHEGAKMLSFDVFGVLFESLPLDGVADHCKEQIIPFAIVRTKK